MPKPSISERLVAIGAEEDRVNRPAGRGVGEPTIWMPGVTFVKTRRVSSIFHLADADNPTGAYCGVIHVDVASREVRRDIVDDFVCSKCVKTLEELAATVAMLADIAALDETPTPEPGDSAHKWAVDGPPLSNAESATSHPMLDCPRCDDVILDVVDLRSGPLSVPRNVHSILGRVWYAWCPACGWTSPDRPSEWTLLEAVNEARN